MGRDDRRDVPCPDGTILSTAGAFDEVAGAFDEVAGAKHIETA